MREGKTPKREWKKKELQFPRMTSSRPQDDQDEIDVEKARR